MFYLVDTKPPEPEAHVERPFELERIIFFSDAVFAIAITLLALELKVPELSAQTSDALLNALASNWGQFVGFALSFWIVAAFWQGHHRYFRYIVRYDDGLIVRNMLVLFFVVLIPFVSLVVGEYGNIPAGEWVYAFDIFAVGVADAVLWQYATSNRRLVEPNLDVRLIRYIQVRSFVTPAVAILVFLLSNVVYENANFGWALIFIIQAVIHRRYYPPEKSAAPARKS